MQEIMENEWSHFLDVDQLEAPGEKITLSPNEEESARLAQRLDLISIESLTATLDIKYSSGSNVVSIKGNINADIVQKCVVSLKPVSEHIEDDFEAWYADKESVVTLARKKQDRDAKGGQSEVKMLDESQDPEPIINGKIDLGELITQYLSLSINPYPHAEGVEEQANKEYGSNSGDDHEAKIDNPFAALKDWKSKLTGEE